MRQWEKLKVAELKEECKARQIPLTGLKLKQQYVDKLIEHEKQHTIEPQNDSGDTDDHKTSNGEVAAPATEDHQSGEPGVKGQERDDGSDLAKDQTSSAAGADTTRLVERVSPAASEQEETEASEATAQDKDGLCASAAPNEVNKDDVFVPTHQVQDSNKDYDAVAHAQKEQNGETRDVINGESSEPLKHQTTDVVADEMMAENEDRKHYPTDGLKRKRKSLSPVIHREEVVKKAKGADGEPIPTKRRSQSHSPQPSPVRSSRNLHDNGEGVDASATLHTMETNPSDEDPSHAQTDAPSASQPIPVDADHVVEAAIHPATRSLYMRNFKRPINGPALREHVTAIALGTAAHTGDEGVIRFFYMDKLKSHAFFTFPSTSIASRVRAFMHRTRFPNEPMREPLWVDFVPDDMVEDWADQETGNGSDSISRNSATKYEVVYNRVDDVFVAQLQEVGSSTQQYGRPASHAATASQSKLSVRVPSYNADSTRTSAVVSAIDAERAIRESEPERQQQRLSSASSPRRQHVDQATGFGALEELFEVTKSKPKLYYKLPSQDAIDGRLDMIRDLYPDRGISGDPGMKRYTFDRLKGSESWVDNGPEFGHGRRGQEILVGSSRGRGRGGYRGRGAARPHGIDSYRGGRWPGG